MHTFETLFMGQFRDKWRSKNPLTLNGTNPQPFTLEGLQALTGQDILKIDPTFLLDYCSGVGQPELRDVLRSELYPSLDPANLITTAGGKEGIFICMHALLEKGDHVISFTPTFEPLIKIAQDVGCEVQLLPLEEKEGWTLDMDKFEASINDATKMVIINFPHNPTGALIDQDTLNRIVALCRKHDVWLFSDEVFRGLEHDPSTRLTAVAEVYEKGISIGVLSKSHGVAGIRVGWVACQNHAFLKRALGVKGYLSVCNGKLSEIIAVPLIENSQLIFENHRLLLVKNLTILEGLKATYSQFKFHPPKAGCTVFAKVDEPAEVFAEKLVARKNLLVIPGPAFVTNENGFRLGFSYHDYETRLKGLKELLDEGNY